MRNLLSNDPTLQGVDTGDEFNFKCKFCNRNLSSRQNLREHIYIHTGVRPYKCTVPGCSKTFRQGSLLSIHRKTHEKNQSHISATKSSAKATYLKLTDCPLDPQMDLSICPDLKSRIICEIGEQNFKFVEKFL